MPLYSRRDILKAGAIAVGSGALIFTNTALRANSSPVAVNNSGVAIDGYDTTAYWAKEQASLGVQAHVVIWNGTPWHFETAEDAAKFREAPENFAPKFGGYCTRAMSFKKVVNGDPEVWRIYEGNLYLFALPVGGEKFDGGQDAMIKKAQAHWDSLA